MSNKTKEYNFGYEHGYREGRRQALLELEGQASDLSATAVEETAHVLRSASGYIRLGIGYDRTFYARYKWTQGPLAGMYTFRSDSLLAVALASLCNAWSSVESGKLKASVDTPYRKK